MTIYKTLLPLTLFFLILSACGSGASSPSTPAQVPISSEDYATIEVSWGVSGVSGSINAEADINKSVDEDIPDLSVTTTCRSESKVNTDWICINPSSYIAGIVKMELGICSDNAIATFSTNSKGNTVATCSDGNAPTWVAIWDATTTTTTVVGSGSLKMYTIDISSGATEIPGTERVTTFGTYSALRFKVGYIGNGLPTDAVLGSLSNADIMTCHANGGCVYNSSLIADSIAGDVIRTDSSAYYWFNDTTDAWVTSRPSDPLMAQQFVSGTEDYDSSIFDSNGIFMAIVKIDNNSDGTADSVTLETGKTYTLTLTSNISSTLSFKDSNSSGAFDNNEDFSNEGPIIGLTATEK